MTKVIVWSAYPSTIKMVRSEILHIQGFGDGLLWWIAEVLKSPPFNNIKVIWGDEVSVGDLSSDTVLLLFDAPVRSCLVTNRLFLSIPKERRVLLRLEPPVIAPSSYKKRFLAEFSTLLRVEPGRDDWIVDHVVDFDVPAPFPKGNSECQEDQRSGIVAISSNKAILGPRGEMYRERVKIYRALTRIQCNFKLYGVGWERVQLGIPVLDLILRKSKVSLFCNDLRKLNYSGEIKDKSIIASSAYCLVIENYIGTHYLSEKIFDSLKYGVLPIYIGGRDIEKIGLSDLVYVAKSIPDILKIVENLPAPMPRELVKEKYRVWLNSKNGYRFGTNFAKNVILKSIPEFPNI